MAQTFNSDIAVLGTLEATRFGDNLAEIIKSEIHESQNECLILADERISERIEEVGTRIARLEGRIDALSEKYNEAIRRFNATIEAVNSISERLSAIEANYDPTIIK